MNGYRLHHIGILVPVIEKHAQDYVQRFGYTIRTDIVHDPLQTAFVQFLEAPGESVFLELVAPDRPDSKLTKALSRGGGLNHLCYAVPDIEGACSDLIASGLPQIHAPTPAVAFNQRRIAWFIGRDRVVFELVEAGLPGEV